MILATKLKNNIKKVQSTGLEFYLKNISVNGEKRGCSGFIKNVETEKIAYVNTEGLQWIGQKHQNLYRIARDLKDYGGSHSRNQWAEDESLAKEVVNLIGK